MRETLVGLLEPFRRRCLVVVMIRAAVVGLIAGSIACAALMLLKASTAAIPLALAAMVAGPVVAAALAMVRRPTEREAAALLDQHYGWHDGTTSALEFSTEPNPSRFVALQVEGVARKLATAQPSEVVPIRAPRGWKLAAAALGVAALTIAWPLIASLARASAPAPEPFAPALEEARQLEDHARLIEAAGLDLADPALQMMLADIRKTIAELKEPGLDMNATMAKLSSLEARIAAEKESLKVGVTDQKLRELGSALLEAKPLEAAGQKLQANEFAQAADQLDQVGDAALAPSEARALEASAGKSVKEMRQNGLEKLADATQKLAEGAKRGGKPIKQGTTDLAKEIRDHERRRRINKLMAQEQQRLKDCKDRCEARNLLARKQSEAAGKPEKGGPPQGAQPQPREGKDGKATQDPEKPANLAGQEALKGLAGEGPSETVTLAGDADGPKPAHHHHHSREIHQKYERISEAALDQDPIPLGYRRSIRRYFELIRPGAAPTADAPAARSDVEK